MLLGSSEGRGDKSEAETARGMTKLGEQVADLALQSATEGTLWGQAYNALKGDNEDKRRSDRIADYEDLLSRVLLFLTHLPGPAVSMASSRVAVQMLTRRGPSPDRMHHPLRTREKMPPRSRTNSILTTRPRTGRSSNE